MTSKIRALGLAFVAVVAMGAMAASAQASVIHVGATNSALTGHKHGAINSTLSIQETGGGTGTAQCPTATLEAHLQGAQTFENIEATATYSGHAGVPCLLFGQAAAVKLNGCKYTLTNKQTTGVTYGSGTATVDITGCTSATTGISIQSGICQVHIPPQTGLSHVVGKTIQPHGTSDAITLEATVSGVKVIQTGVACPDGTNHTSTTGQFKANTIVTAFTNPVTAQATEHSHQFLRVTHGAQTSLTVT
jgi:hypothetical protein